MKRMLFVLVFSLAAMTTRTSAQTGAYATFEYEGWTFAPIVTGGVIKGHLAWADPLTLTGNNVPIVMYLKDGVDQWSTWGWTEYDLGAAVAQVREQFADPAIFTLEPTLGSAVSGTSVANPSKLIEDGVFEDDPIRAIIQESPDPVALISTLVDLGWEAAPNLSQLAVEMPELCPDTTTIVGPVVSLLNERTRDMELIILGQALTNVTCTLWPCAGCTTIFDMPVAVPGSFWRFAYSGNVPSMGITLCYWDRDATVAYTKTGVSTLLCLDCTASGIKNTSLHMTTSVPLGQPCVGP